MPSSQDFSAADLVLGAAAGTGVLLSSLQQTKNLRQTKKSRSQGSAAPNRPVGLFYSLIFRQALFIKILMKYHYIFFLFIIKNEGYN